MTISSCWDTAWVVVAWGCALWSPLRESRPLTGAEAGAVLTAHLGEHEFVGSPHGIRNFGPGWALVQAVDARPAQPPLALARPGPNRSAGTPGLRALPPGPDTSLVQIATAGCSNGDTGR